MNNTISSEELTRLANNLDDEMKRFDQKCERVAIVLYNIGVKDFMTDYIHQNNGLFLSDNPHIAESEAVELGVKFKKYSENYTKVRELVKVKFGFIRDKMREYVVESTAAQSEASSDLENLTATLDSTQDKFN